MSTVAQVTAAWNTYVFAHSTVQAITTKIYNFDAVSMADNSRVYDAQLHYGQTYNFFQWRATKFINSQNIGGSKLYIYPVTVQYFIEADIDGSNFAAAELAFETLYTRVNSGLGTTWDSTVDFYTPQPNRPALSEYIINDTVCWMWSYEYVGTKTGS